MKVVILMPIAEQRGGSELTLLYFMKECKNKKDWLVIFLEDGTMVQQIKRFGIKTKVVEAGRLRNPLKFISTIKHIIDIAKREKAELIFSWMEKAHIYGGLVSLLLGINSIWYRRNMPSKSIMDKFITILPTKKIFTNSKTVAKAQDNIWPKHKIATIHSAVNLEKFNTFKLLTPSKTKKKLKLPKKGQIIGIVGRLQKWKGMHTLIEAMPYILKKYSNAHCVIVGDKHDLEPEYPDYLKNLIKESRLKNKVTLAGFQTNISEWMQAMDVVIHASKNEPFGIVIVEAMALGKPVVAGKNGGPTEIITEGVNGLFAPYGNSKLLAKQILRYLNNPEFSKKIGEAAKKRARDFSTKNYIKKLVNNIKNIK